MTRPVFFIDQCIHPIVIPARFWRESRALETGWALGSPPDALSESLEAQVRAFPLRGVNRFFDAYCGIASPAPEKQGRPAAQSKSLENQTRVIRFAG